jgi:protein tyrosine phosphatase (PTP) superfamily phosphohydrolase (DUF442 family)
MVIPIAMVTYFPTDPDDEFPGVRRPTYSAVPPMAIRWAEPGDTTDRLGLYLASIGFGLSLLGWVRSSSKRSGRSDPVWMFSFGVCAFAMWLAAAPWPTFDGWHGWSWRAIGDRTTPMSVRLVLIVFAVCLLSWISHWGWRLRKGVSLGQQVRMGLEEKAWISLTLVGVIWRLLENPNGEPAGFWPRWGLVWGMLAWCFALWRWMPPRTQAVPRETARLMMIGAISLGCVVFGLKVIEHHRPLARMRCVESGRIYISAMPTYGGLQVAHGRHGFKTIVNLFPEHTSQRSPLLEDEIRFAREHGIKYVLCPEEDAEQDRFLVQTLAMARDPSNWPMLVHCHGCMDRSPAWMGMYRFLMQGASLTSVFQEMEGHRGWRPKASVIFLYLYYLGRLAPDRLEADPLCREMREHVRGIPSPYEGRERRHPDREDVIALQGDGVAGRRRP